MSTRFRMPPRFNQGMGVLEQEPDGSWVQRVARPDEDIGAYTQIGDEAWSDMLQDPAFTGPPNATDPALQRVRVRPATPSPTSPGGFESLAPFAPGGPKAAQEGPQQAQVAAIPPGPMGAAGRFAADGAMGAGTHGGHAGRGGSAAGGALPPEVLAALQLSNRNRMFAGLARGGQMIGAAIGGTKPDQEALAALDAGAEQPMRDVQAIAAARQAQTQQGRESEKYAAEMGAMQSEADPTSAESVSARAVFARMLPEATKLPGFDKLSMAQLKKQFPFAKEILDAKAREQSAGGARADRALTRELMLQEKQDRRMEADVQKLGKQTEDMAALNSDIKTVLGYANQEGSIPGAGKWDSRKPDWLQSEDDTTVRQATMRVVVTMLRLTSGVAVTPQEAERFMEANGWGPGATEDRWKAGVKAFIRDQTAKLKAQQAKFRPEVVDTLRERGGFTADQLPTGGGGKEIVKYKRSPDGKVRVPVYADGSYGPEEPAP